MSNRTTSRVILPPPAGTILLYAADGLAKREGNLSPAGRPRTPKRSIWVPLFRDYIDSDEGLGTLHALAEEGMDAWDCSDDEVNSLSSAFVDVSFRALSIAALEYFAATASEKISLQKSPKTSPPEPAKAEPEIGAKPDTLYTSAYTSAPPQRPSQRPNFHRFTP